MGFTTGDKIIYGGNGVCEIEDIKDISFCRGNAEKFYVLKQMFVPRSNIIYVPFDNANQVSKFKKVISKKEAMAIISRIPIKGVEWIEDRNARKAAFNEILAGGSREEIVSMISLIESHRDELAKEGKKLNAQDERVLVEALRRINTEFAVALNMMPDEVDKFIRDSKETALAE